MIRQALPVACLALLVLAPGALGQPVSLAVNEVGLPLRPAGAPGVSQVTVTVDCSQLTGDTHGHVQLTVDPPTGFQAALAPSGASFEVSSCAGSTWTATADLSVAASMRAPAFQASALVVSAHLTTGTVEESAHANVPVQAGYASLTSARALEPMLTAEPGETVSIPLELINLGNGATRFDFSLLPPGGPTNAADIIAPAPMVLSSPLEDLEHARGEAEILVTLPEGSPEDLGPVAVQLEVDTSAAIDNQIKGTSHLVNVLVLPAEEDAPPPVSTSDEDGDPPADDPGQSDDAPGPGAWLALAALGLAAARVRGRRP